ncbi:MAG: VanZ family protein [Azoarcus sp.]|nr:VanZ family protein [Azoarcus sp.]
MFRVSPLLYRGLFVFALVVVFWLALQPAPDVIQIVSWQDKVEHAVLFAVLMVLGNLAWPGRMLPVVLGLLAYGAAMEVAQSFTDYRFGDLWDWIADAIGLLIAAFPARQLASRFGAHPVPSADHSGARNQA